MWEEESDTQRLTGAVSDRIELQLAEIVEEEEPKNANRLHGLAFGAYVILIAAATIL